MNHGILKQEKNKENRNYDNIRERENEEEKMAFFHNKKKKNHIQMQM